MPHPVLAKIDRDRPYFTRAIVGRGREGDRQCELQVWLPVQLDNGGWVAAVHLAGLDLPPISAMPGEDPLDALIEALAFARDVVDRAEGRFLFGDRSREGAGLPVSLNRGFPATQLADIGARAMRIADAEADRMHAHLRPAP